MLARREIAAILESRSRYLLENKAHIFQPHQKPPRELSREEVRWSTGALLSWCVCMQSITQQSADLSVFFEFGVFSEHINLAALFEHPTDGQVNRIGDLYEVAAAEGAAC